MRAKPIPEGYHSVTPYLAVEGASRLIDFLKHTFGAEVREHIPGENGSVRHAEVMIGNSMVMLGDATCEAGPRPGNLYVYVEDTDATYRRALEAGAESIREPADQFYGDRSAGVKDPFGNHWWIATHIEDVAPEEIARRAAAAKH